MTDKQQPFTYNTQLIQNNESKFFLASIIDTLQDSVVTINLDGIITSWNKAAERMYGYPASEAIGRSLHMVMFPKDFEPLRNSIEAIRTGHRVPVYHTLRMHKNGHNMHIEITLSPVQDAQGSVIGVSTIARDITDLNAARHALAASESRLRAIIEAAVDFAIITLNTEGIITDWNAGAEKMFGHTREEAIGKHTEIIFTPEDRHGDMPMVEIEVARTEGRSIDERWHLHKDGSRFFMSGVMTPLQEGPIRGFVKVARNITDRKLAEEALLLAEERKSLAVRSAQMGEWEWDITNDTVHISDAVKALYGFPDSQNEMPRDVLNSMIYPPDAAAVQAQLKSALEGLRIFQAEHRIVRADNAEIRWVNVYGRIIAQEGGRPSRMIGVIYDITPRKLLEKQKDDFISLASHELKTPVTAIKVYSEVLEEKLSGSTPGTNLSILKKLHEQVDRLIKLIQTLLDSSTLSEGKMHLHPATFDLNQAIAEQLEPFRHIARNRTIKWEPAAIAMVHADRDRILQVVTNFVSNAVKYSPEEAEIIISTEDNYEHVLVKVRDAGPGIPLDVQPYLFDRYYRVPGQHQDQEGFGLGLFISAAIIRQHMGTIGVESQPGKGATFYFTLPYS